jgi:hypothetical protein
MDPFYCANIKTRTDRLPDYVGFFDNQPTLNLHYDKIALFFLYILKKKKLETFKGARIIEIEGSIDDIFGSATFQGIIQDDTLSFSKKYIGDSINPLKGEIYFKGQSNAVGDMYFGKYEHKDKSGNFFMKEFNVPFLH